MRIRLYGMCRYLQQLEARACNVRLIRESYFSPFGRKFQKGMLKAPFGSHIIDKINIAYLF